MTYEHECKLMNLKENVENEWQLLAERERDESRIVDKTVPQDQDYADAVDV